MCVECKNYYGKRGERMNWFNVVNKATQYIEDNIKEDISLDNVSKHVHLSHSHFLKIFHMLTTYSLKEYIRNRRLSLASYEIVQTNQRIIDVAFRYGYNSHEAFSRAFKQMHGVSPSVARKMGISLSFFPRLVYDMPLHNITDMNYQYVQYDKRTYVGLIKHIKGRNKNHQLVSIQQTYTDFKNIDSLMETPLPITSIITNIVGAYDEYDYFIGVESDSVEEKEHIVTLPKGRYLQYSARTTDPRSINLFKDNLLQEWADYDYFFEGYHELEWVVKDGETYVIYFNARLQVDSE